jgi:hypothetical protein
MRKIILFSLFLFSCIVISAPADSAVIYPALQNNELPAQLYKKIISLKVKDVQKMIGRKLTLKEKISFIVLKLYAKKHTDPASNQGQASFTWGIIAITLFFLGLFIPYLIFGAVVAAIIAIVKGSMAKKQNSDDNKAFIGRLLGWITLGLFALLLILVAALIAAFASWI